MNASILISPIGGLGKIRKTESTHTNTHPNLEGMNDHIVLIRVWWSVTSYFAESTEQQLRADSAK